MSTLPLKTFSSSSPESEEVWDAIFKADRSTQPDYEESDVDECIEDDYSENDNE